MIIVKYFNLLWNKVGQSGTVKKKKKQRRKAVKEREKKKLPF